MGKMRTDGNGLPILISGDFGSPPFCGQLSGTQCACQCMNFSLSSAQCHRASIAQLGHAAM